MINIQGDFTIWFGQKDGKPHLEIRCALCGTAPEKAKGASDKPVLVYLLNCPKCKETLIEYSSPEELSADLSKIVDKWRV
jgi:phage FluMu protein Com